MSMAVIIIAAGILTGMVLYSVSLMRSAQLQILTGERGDASQPMGEFLAYSTAD